MIGIVLPPARGCYSESLEKCNDGESWRKTLKSIYEVFFRRYGLNLKVNKSQKLNFTSVSNGQLQDILY